MNKVFAVVEVGSTNTKAYLYEENKITNLPFINIEFKKNYNSDGYIADSDKKELYDYINSIKKYTSDINVYGTSIFRKLDDSKKEEFLIEFNKATGLNFNIVSQEDESKYTVFGAVASIKYDGNIAVMIGGGGSTEIAIVNKGKLIEERNLDMGVMDINRLYPDLVNQTATTNISEVKEYIKKHLTTIDNKASLLVLAGGFHKMFREMAGYQFVSDMNFEYDKTAMVITNKENTYKRDEEYFTSVPLETMRVKTPDMPKWWDGTRAMLSFVQCVMDLCEAEYVISTDIGMVYGIVEELKNRVNV